MDLDLLTKGQVHVNNGMFQRCASLTVISHIGESRTATRAFALLSPSTRNRASRPRVFVSHETERKEYSFIHARNVAMVVVAVVVVLRVVVVVGAAAATARFANNLLII